MSQRTEQANESSILDRYDLGVLEDWYHVPVIAVLLAFMLWVRVQAYDNFVRNGEVFFAGNDAWYHLRQVTYTVHNWPKTMPFDPWTYYPYGTSVGQFGTLYDQLVATVALIVGLGSPSDQTIAMTLLFAPAVFGALTLIPTYLIGKRLGGRLGGLFGVLIIALLPGLFLGRSLVGASDHNGAEPLFQAFAVLATMVAVTVAEREKPVYELLADRQFRALRGPLGWSVLAGVALAVYLWVWPPGVLLMGIFGVFYLLKLTADYVRGVSPDHLAFVAATSLGVAGILMLIPLGTTEFSATKFSLLQPLVAFVIAGGSVFMAWLAREWESRDLSPTLYPAAILGIIALGALVVYAALPSLFGMIQSNLVRFIGFGGSAQMSTIGEAQPLLSQTSPQAGITWATVLMNQYGLMFFTALLGALLMLWEAYAREESRGEYLLVLVWTAFITSAAFTQVRFNYYLVVPVAVLNAYLVGRVFRAVDLTSVGGSIREINGTQVITVLFVIVLVVPVLVVPIPYGSSGQNTATAWQTGGGANPDAITKWDGTLDWMANQTPAEGTYGGSSDGEMEYYGTYAEDDGDFDYPSGAYGVMSWWDYGHWITVEGERIPNANPFQEGARTAANYLLAQNETEANDVLQRLGSDGEQTRYVMVDWKMAATDAPGRKFFAPTQFAENASQSDFYERLYQSSNQGIRATSLHLRSQDYYQSQMVRLYMYHGSAVESRPVVVDYDTMTAQTQSGQQVTIKTLPQGQNASIVRRFDTMQQARQFVQQDGSAQIGGLGTYPTERVPALQHYRLVKASQNSSFEDSGNYRNLIQTMQATGLRPNEMVGSNSAAWVKAFERVPGATVEGTAPANSTVTASVEMRMPGSNSTFTYTQRAQAGQDGSFTMTLPYSTTGYDQWGTEKGYTNASVRATGPYEFRTGTTAEDDGFVYHNATAQVSEAKVIGEDGSPVQVSVDNRQVDTPEGAQNNSTSNGSASNGTTPTNGTSSGAANGSTATDGSSASLTGQSPGADADGRNADPAARAGLVGLYGAAVLVARRG